MQTWLRSDEYALLDNIALLPRCSGPWSTDPMVTESEEGFAYFLIDNAKKGWILKKFLPGQEPDRDYGDAIQALIPKITGFESGFERRILKTLSVSRATFCNGEFQAWMYGCSCPAVRIPERHLNLPGSPPRSRTPRLEKVPYWDLISCQSSQASWSSCRASLFLI